MWHCYVTACLTKAYSSLFWISQSLLQDFQGLCKSFDVQPWLNWCSIFVSATMFKRCLLVCFLMTKKWPKDVKPERAGLISCNKTIKKDLFERESESSWVFSFSHLHHYKHDADGIITVLLPFNSRFQTQKELIAQLRHISAILKVCCLTATYTNVNQHDVIYFQLEASMSTVKFHFLLRDSRLRSLTR